MSMPEVIHVDLEKTETNIVNAKLNLTIDVEKFMAELRKVVAIDVLLR